MAHEWDVLPHIMEIKERLAAIETGIKEQKEDLKEHSQKSISMQDRVQKIESKMDKVEGNIAVIKWLAPTAPAVLLAILKLAGYL